MTRVLLLATTTGYQIRSFGDAATRLGIRLQFVSDRCDRLVDPWWDAAIPVRFHDEEAAVEAVVRACAGVPPDGIVAVGDRPAVLAARVTSAFGLAGHPPAAAAASRNKLAAKAAFRAAGLATPSFRAVSVDDDEELLAQSTEYPAVIKPLALSGSRGVIRADTAPEFARAFARVRALLRSPDIAREQDTAHTRILIESFVPGAEYAVEGVLTRGVFHAFAIFDKPDPLDGPFFEETIYVTPSRAEVGVQSRILDAVVAAIQALGLWHGPVHAECRVNAEGVHVLEVAARPIGGLCARAVRLVAPGGASASLEEVLLRHAIGEDVSGFQREQDASGVMMLPIPKRGVYRGVEGVDEARAVAGVDDVVITARPEALIVPLPEGRSYLGFVFAHGDSGQAVEHALRTAHERLRFTIGREVPLT